jgi:hypothetical protein
VGLPASSWRKPDYGLDAPTVIRALFLIGGADLSGAGAPYSWYSPPRRHPLREIGLIVGVNFWLNAGGMICYSWIAKLSGLEGRPRRDRDGDARYCRL